jgi:hypothetical protein
MARSSIRQPPLASTALPHDLVPRAKDITADEGQGVSKDAVGDCEANCRVAGRRARVIGAPDERLHG